MTTDRELAERLRLIRAPAWLSPAEHELLEQAAARLEQRDKDAEKMRAALAEAENALLDYVDRLEKMGGQMNYGRSVLRSIRAARLPEES